MTTSTLRIDPPHQPELEYVDSVVNTTGRCNFTLADIAPEIREKLTLRLSNRILQHQLNALPRSLHLASQGLSWVLIGGTGTGKAYYTGGLIHELRRHEIIDSTQAVLLVTKAPIVTQTYRVLTKEFGLADIQAVSYETLRTSLGEMYITWKTTIGLDGHPRVTPIWCPPEESGISMIICDECQALKNDDSQAAQIIQQAALAGYKIVFMSATPFSRAQHVRTIALSLKPIIKIGNARFRLDNNSYPAWLRTITDNPAQWDSADMKRVCKALEEQIIRFENVRFAHMFKIRQIVIPFASPEHRRIYDEAFAEYQAIRLQQGRDTLTGFAAVLVALRKFNQKAELLRAEYLAKSAFQCVNSKKRPVNAIIACNFLDTIFVAEKALLRLGVSPDNISIIKGGQSAKDRQINIDRFNNEKTRYMILSFGAGGAGLSLHHTPNKKYPSEIFLPPVWNSEDLVQVLGRAHRINSQSTTYQNLIWFADTMEERIADKVKTKCAALKEVVGANERWVMAMDNSGELRSAHQVNISQLRDADEEDGESEVSEELLESCGGNANATTHQLII